MLSIWQILVRITATNSKEQEGGHSKSIVWFGIDYDMRCAPAFRGGFGVVLGM